MLVVNMPVNTQEVANSLDNLTIDGITFQVIEVSGIKIKLTASCSDLNIAKDSLKAYLKSNISAGLFFNVVIS